MADRPSTVTDGLRLALTTLTIAPLAPGRIDRRVAGAAMLWAPAVGFALAIPVASLVYGARQLFGLYGISGGISAALAVALLAVLTRGLHLDGLADTTDAIGATTTRERRLEIMRDPHIGAFGAAALVIVLLTQVIALTTTVNSGLGTVSLLTALTTARLAVMWACVEGVPAARAEGLGALVAGTVKPLLAAAVTVVTTVVLCFAAVVHDHGGWPEVGRVCWSIGAGLGAGWLLRIGATRRFGGITGDVLGATVEVVTAVVLIAVAIRAPNLR
jgi:adenosylcobinamide-GDP ribazoletransferase